MFVLEAQVNRMLPLIDNELESVDRNHAKLTQLSTSLVESINLYHMLMRESEHLGPSHYYGVPHQNQFSPHQPPHNQGFQMPPNPHPHPHSLAMDHQQYQQQQQQFQPGVPPNFIPQNPNNY